MRGLILIVLTAFSCPAGAAVLRETAGLVQVREDGSQRWRPAGRLPRTLAPGDAVRTGFQARAVIALDDAGVLEAAGGTQVSFDEAVRGGAAVNLAFGSVRVSARSLG